ncbi:MAG TPA: hypothetical protein VE395_01210 [Acidimicrobiales bacterium]|jgi:hypothetical protein|nr:hypothetical protein [Acidimicrobiales bacterium]
MRREESSANPETNRGTNPDKAEGHDDANANPGSGASGPGERAYDSESQVSGDEGEAAIDVEEKRSAMEHDPVANDPANQADA